MRLSFPHGPRRKGASRSSSINQINIATAHESTMAEWVMMVRTIRLSKSADNQDNTAIVPRVNIRGALQLFAGRLCTHLDHEVNCGKGGG